MYLGAHMINDYYWPNPMPENAKNENNVQFSSDISVIALRKISAGEELFVSYNISGDMLG